MGEAGFLVMDGGMGRELQHRGLADVGGTWSAGALLTHPEVVRDAHLAFIEAGAEIIITNTYAVTPLMLGRVGMEDRLGELLDIAVRVAREARDMASRDGTGREVRIAGGLPPLGQSYRPDLVGPEEEIVPLYREIAGRMAPGVDCFVCETMSSAAEARAAAGAAAGFGKPVWVAWTIEDTANGLLRSDETVSEAVAALGDVPVEAFLFNCCSPESVSRALPELRAATAKPVGAYANALLAFPKGYVMGTGSGEGGAQPERADVTPAAYAGFARDWRAMGADIIGGCCGIGPAHIRELARALA